MPARPIAADQNLAAAGLAGRVDLGVRDLDVLAGDRRRCRRLVPFFLPAAESLPAILHRLLRRAAALRAAGRGAEHNHAVMGADRIGLDHAFVVDDRVRPPPRGGGRQLDAAAIGLELALVADQRLQRLSGRHILDLRGDLVADTELDQLVAVEVEREHVAGGKAHGAERRGDGAGVAHARRHQRGKAAARSGDVALVDDRGVRPPGNIEIVAAGHEVVVLDVVRGGDKARGVDDRIGPQTACRRG